MNLGLFFLIVLAFALAGGLIGAAIEHRLRGVVLRAEIDSIKSEIAEDLTSLRDAILEIDGALASLDGLLRTRDRRVDASIAVTDARLDIHADRLDDIEEQVASLAAAADEADELASELAAEDALAMRRTREILVELATKHDELARHQEEVGICFQRLAETIG